MGLRAGGGVPRCRDAQAPACRGPWRKDAGEGRAGSPGLVPRHQPQDGWARELASHREMVSSTRLAHLGSDQGPLPASRPVGVGGADCRAAQSGSCCRSTGAPPAAGPPGIPRGLCGGGRVPAWQSQGLCRLRKQGAPPSGRCGTEDSHRRQGTTPLLSPGLPFRSRNADGSAAVGMNRPQGPPSLQSLSVWVGDAEAAQAVAALVSLDQGWGSLGLLVLVSDSPGGRACASAVSFE